MDTSFPQSPVPGLQLPAVTRPAGVPGTAGNGVGKSGRATYWNRQAALKGAGCWVERRGAGFGNGCGETGSKAPPGRIGSQLWALGCGVLWDWELAAPVAGRGLAIVDGPCRERVSES